MHVPRFSAARAPAHEVVALETDVARLTRGFLRAGLDRLRRGLLVFFVRVVLLRAAAARDLAADFPMSKRALDNRRKTLAELEAIISKNKS
jgi:hypothetical protein